MWLSMDNIWYHNQLQNTYAKIQKLLRLARLAFYTLSLSELRVVGLHHILAESILTLRGHHRCCSRRPCLHGSRLLHRHHRLGSIAASYVRNVGAPCDVLRWTWKARAVLIFGSFSSCGILIFLSSTSKLLVLWRPPKAVKGPLPLVLPGIVQCAYASLRLLSLLVLILRPHIRRLLWLQHRCLGLLLWHAKVVTAVFPAQRCLICALPLQIVATCSAFGRWKWLESFILVCTCIHCIRRSLTAVLTARNLHSTHRVKIHGRVNNIITATTSDLTAASHPLHLHLLLLRGRQERLLL